MFVFLSDEKCLIFQGNHWLAAFHMKYQTLSFRQKQLWKISFFLSVAVEGSTISF